MCIGRPYFSSRGEREDRLGEVRAGTTRGKGLSSSMGEGVVGTGSFLIVMVMGGLEFSSRPDEIPIMGGTSLTDTLGALSMGAISNFTFLAGTSSPLAGVRAGAIGPLAGVAVALAGVLAALAGPISAFSGTVVLPSVSVVDGDFFLFGLVCSGCKCLLVLLPDVGVLVLAAAASLEERGGGGVCGGGWRRGVGQGVWCVPVM